MLLKILLDSGAFCSNKILQRFGVFSNFICLNNYCLPVSGELELSSSQLWLHIRIT